MRCIAEGALPFALREEAKSGRSLKAQRPGLTIPIPPAGTNVELDATLT